STARSTSASRRSFCAIRPTRPLFPRRDAGVRWPALTPQQPLPADLYREHARFVWGLCYRLTGCAADADDLVQETFARALTHPPPRTDEPWRPWLIRVAVNLGKDLLRRRRRIEYEGPWLPSPV